MAADSRLQDAHLSGPKSEGNLLHQLSQDTVDTGGHTHRCRKCWLGDGCTKHPQNQKHLSFHPPHRVHQGLLNHPSTPSRCKAGGKNGGACVCAHRAVAVTLRCL